MQDNKNQDTEKLEGKDVQLVETPVEEIVLASEDEVGMTDEEIEAFDSALGLTYVEE